MGAEDYIPPTDDLTQLDEAVDRCRGCELYRGTTQGVFGEGPRTARIMLVGEQPGDREDIEGHVFVGPAGRVLEQCLGDAGIDRSEAFLTNAVKHFKHEVRGKRRIHQKPTTAEVTACHPWLDVELTLVRPVVVVALGATAARAVFGRAMGIEASRGRAHRVDGRLVVVTYHPSAVLRAEDRAAEVRHALVEDLRLAAATADAAAAS